MSHFWLWLTLPYCILFFFLLIEEELHASYWNKQGRQAIQTALNIEPNLSQAKNLILFLGDGESEKGAFPQFK